MFDGIKDLVSGRKLARPEGQKEHVSFRQLTLSVTPRKPPRPPPQRSGGNPRAVRGTTGRPSTSKKGKF